MSMTSDEMLDLLAKVGRPRLYRHDDGKWSAKLKLPAPSGCTAEIASDFDHPTHRAALAKVIERMGQLKTTAAALPQITAGR